MFRYSCIGKVISGICDCGSSCVRTLTGKRLELSILNLPYVYSVARPWRGFTLRSKGEGHVIIRSTASMGLQVDMTA